MILDRFPSGRVEAPGPEERAQRRPSLNPRMEAEASMKTPIRALARVLLIVSVVAWWRRASWSSRAASTGCARRPGAAAWRRSRSSPSPRAPVRSACARRGSPPSPIRSRLRRGHRRRARAGRRRRLDPAIDQDSATSSRPTRSGRSRGDPTVVDARWTEMGVGEVQCADGRLYMSAGAARRAARPASASARPGSSWGRSWAPWAASPGDPRPGLRRLRRHAGGRDHLHRPRASRSRCASASTSARAICAASATSTTPRSTAR